MEAKIQKTVIQDLGPEIKERATLGGPGDGVDRRIEIPVEVLSDLVWVGRSSSTLRAVVRGVGVRVQLLEDKTGHRWEVWTLSGTGVNPEKVVTEGMFLPVWLKDIKSDLGQDALRRLQAALDPDNWPAPPEGAEVIRTWRLPEGRGVVEDRVWILSLQDLRQLEHVARSSGEGKIVIHGAGLEISGRVHAATVKVDAETLERTEIPGAPFESWKLLGTRPVPKGSNSDQGVR